MATERIALGINLRKNKNSKSSGYNKYYPAVDQQKTLSLRGFAEHMISHGSSYKRSMLEGVLNEICECLPELVSQGVGVKLGSLGTFYPTAKVSKNAAVNSIAEMEGLNPNDIVEGIRLRFRPDSTKLDNLCGPAFKQRCSLELRNILDTQQVTVNGKLKKVQTLKPISTAVAEWKSENGSDSTGTNSGSNQNGGGTNTGGNTGGGNTGGGGDEPGGDGNDQN